MVKTLIPNRTLTAGIHQVDWEGRDEQGRPVAAGVYLYRLAAGDQAIVRKMTCCGDRPRTGSAMLSETRTGRLLRESYEPAK